MNVGRRGLVVVYYGVTIFIHTHADFDRLNLKILRISQNLVHSPSCIHIGIAPFSGFICTRSIEITVDVILC